MSYNLTPLPATKKEWDDAVKKYRDWAKIQTTAFKADKRMRKQLRLPPPNPPPPQIHPTWILEDINIVNSASKIDAAQFLLLHVTFQSREDTQVDSIELEKRGVLSESAFTRAAEELKNDAAFQKLLQLVREDRFLDRDTKTSIELLSRFSLVRRNLDLLQRSQWEPAAPAAPASPPMTRTRARAADLEDERSHVVVFATPKKEAKAGDGLDTSWRGEAGQEEGDEDEDDIGNITDKIRDLTLSDERPETPQGNRNDDSYCPETPQGKTNDDSTFLSPGSVLSDDDSRLESALKVITSDEAKCLVCIVDLLNALFLPVVPHLEAVPEQQLFRIRGPGESGDSLLASKVDAVLRWRDDEQSDTYDNRQILNIIEVKRREEDTDAVKMQHAAEMVAYVAEKTRADALASLERTEPQRQQLNGGCVVLIAQNFTSIKIRVGVYDAAFVKQLHHKKVKTRGTKAFMHVYTSRMYTISKHNKLQELCELLLALGITHEEKESARRLLGEA